MSFKLNLTTSSPSIPVAKPKSTTATTTTTTDVRKRDDDSRSKPIVSSNTISIPTSVTATDNTTSTSTSNAPTTTTWTTWKSSKPLPPNPHLAGTRKNPTDRPLPTPPQELLQQIRNAPAQEDVTRTSTHFLSEGKNEGFDSLGLHPALLHHVLSTEKGGMGLVKPTKVQSRLIPVLLSGRDAVVRSETGSGKTLSYLLPILTKLAEKPKARRDEGISAIILAPTRELCVQILDVLSSASRPFPWIISSAVVGGEKRKSEKARLRKGLNILIATPGRLIDHLNTTQTLNESLRKGEMKWLILDEADRLMDAGFEKQVDEILNKIEQVSGGGNEDSTTSSGRSARQTVLLSATLPQNVLKLAGRALREPVRIEVAREESSNSTSAVNSTNHSALNSKSETDTGKEEGEEYSIPKQLVQHYTLVESKFRLVALAAFIRRHVRRTGNTSKMLVFVASRAVSEFVCAIMQRVEWSHEGGVGVSNPSQKFEANNKKHRFREEEKDENGGGESTRDFDEDAGDGPRKEHGGEDDAIKSLGTKCFLLHGSVAQNVRKKTIADFRNAKGAVMVCTDVAARGLDLPDVDLVIQYDPPTEIADYVHRIGRTARSGRRGTAALFLRESELAYVKILENHNLHVTPLKMTYDSLLPPGKKHDEAAVAEAQYLLQKRFESMAEKDKDLNTKARDAFTSYVGAYAVHSSETKAIFSPRLLHLGHVASSFALREPPQKISVGINNKRARVDGEDGAKRSRVGSSDKADKKQEDAEERERIRKMKRKTIDFKNEFAAG